jgi:hypothetical protein
MFAYKFPQPLESSPLSVGVFDDDPLLLRLAARSVSAELDRLRTHTLRGNRDDVASEPAILVDFGDWPF